MNKRIAALPIVGIIALGIFMALVGHSDVAGIAFGAAIICIVCFPREK